MLVLMWQQRKEDFIPIQCEAWILQCVYLSKIQTFSCFLLYVLFLCFWNTRTFNDFVMLRLSLKSKTTLQIRPFFETVHKSNHIEKPFFERSWCFCDVLLRRDLAKNSFTYTYHAYYYQNMLMTFSSPCQNSV